MRAAVDIPLVEISNLFNIFVVYTGLSGLGGGPGSNGGGYLLTFEKAKISRFFKLENFQKMLKKQ